MTIRSILTSYTGSGGGAAALHMALLVTRKYDAHLTAALWQPPNPLRARAGAFMTREIDRVLDQAEAEFAASRRAAFEQAVAQAGLAGQADFVVLDARGGGISEAARGHDIVILGAPTDRDRAAEFSTRPDVVALRSGRPVLIVPQGYAEPAIRETAVVAWDGKRAAARALGDAMHILGTKDKVTLLGVGNDLPAQFGQDALRLLARHGIEADLVTRPAPARGAGAAILDACTELGAGLLIMGAYEHSKFSEDLLGGATRDILSDARLPVLMSH